MTNNSSFMGWDDLTSDRDFSMFGDPFESDAFDSDAFDYARDDELYDLFAALDAGDPGAQPSDVPPDYASDDGWRWHDAALIAVERLQPGTQEASYSIGAVEMYANARTGDLGGTYLEMGTFDDIDEAVDTFHQLQREMHEQQLLPFHLLEFATERTAERAAEQGKPAPEWRSATEVEYAAYEDMRSLLPSQAPDLPPDDLDLEALFDTGFETEAVEGPALKALRDIGLAADGFDSQSDPPPFVDPATGTAYWIGVFQPDKEDPEHCVTSILSLGRDPDSGEMEAQLAPCVPGDWDKTYEAAEYLLGVVEKDGIERAFETAEGLALATDQRDLWQGERGLALDAGAAQELADFTRDEWEIDL